MATVLISGASDRATQVAAALQDAGAKTVVVNDPDQLAQSVTGQRFDAYIQLPVLVETTADSVVGRVEQFLTAGLLSRFRAATAVLPALCPTARVLLVSGQTNIDIDVPDDRAARTALMRVLGHALRAERAPERLSVKICDPTWTAEQLAEAALRPAQPRQAPATEPADQSQVSYADWRTEVLGRMGAEF